MRLFKWLKRQNAPLREGENVISIKLSNGKRLNFDRPVSIWRAMVLREEAEKPLES